MEESSVDDTIAGSVKHALQRDARVRSEGISVRVQGGVVTLSGTVPQHRDRLLASDVAWRIEGVMEVRSELEVQASISRASMDVANDLAEALDRDERVNADGIVVDVSEAIVRLSGAVSSRDERKAVEEVAWATGGVVDVVNGLVLSPDKSRSDEDIARDARRSLDKDARLADATGIGVRSTAGRIRLDGFVASAEEREAAEEDAWYTPGVVYVENMLAIRRSRERPSAA